MSENKTPVFRISKNDIIWSVRTFVISALVAFMLSILLYATTFILTEPTFVDEAIISTATAATAKVAVTAKYISPLWALFIFNSIAALCASIGTPLFLLVHPMMLADIRFRETHSKYASIFIAFERLLMPLNRLLEKIVHRIDEKFPYSEKDTSEKEGIWEYSGYTQAEYRMFAYMLPYTIPIMIVLVNGILMGILLAFFVFNGALDGYEMGGLKVVALGIGYTIIYFTISIIPHGIIEIPAILIAASLGYNFASTHATRVIDKGLFYGNTYESVKKDIDEVLADIRLYFSSGHVWKISATVVLMLLLAAHIEANITQDIVDNVMLWLEGHIMNKT